MKHRRVGRKLGVTKSHRKALLSNLAISLFEKKSIRTTLSKAKEVSRYSERLITFGKKNTVAARRHVYKFLKSHKIVKELFDEIAPNYSDRDGGYTRVLKLGTRPGDGAEMAIVELLGYKKAKKKKKEKAEKKDKKAEKKGVKESVKNGEDQSVEEVAEIEDKTKEETSVEDRKVVKKEKKEKKKEKVKKKEEPSEEKVSKDEKIIEEKSSEEKETQAESPLEEKKDIAKESESEPEAGDKETDKDDKKAEDK
ncbi:50S ribosomal protein L17 [candidate division KSB1 bacterium]